MSFEDLRAFLLVAEHGSFFSAAMAMGVSRTTLRRQVEALEARTGVPLLERARKGVQVTEAGRRLLGGGREMERDFTALLTAVSETGRRPQGEVRMVVQIGLPPPAMVTVFGIFRASWPDMQLRVRFGDAPLTEDLSDADVLVWFGLTAPGSPWETFTILPVRLRLFASSAYLQARGTPESIADLGKHDLLAWLPADERQATLMTVEGGTSPIQPVMASANVDLLHECARAGHGIVWAPDGGFPPLPGQEPMVPVLEELVGGTTELRLAMPKALTNVPKFRIFLDSMQVVRDVTPPGPAGSASPGPKKNPAGSAVPGKSRRGKAT